MATRAPSLKTKRLKLRAAMAALSLGHEWAPSTPNTRGFNTVFVGYDGVPFDYELVSPRATGLSATELEELFTKDQDLKYEKAFTHRYFEGDAKTLMGAMVSLYAHGLPFEGEFRTPSGIESERQGARYTLIARNTRGEIGGFVTFSVHIYSVESVADELGETTSALDELRSFYFKLELEKIYTRRRFRGKGFGGALVEGIAEVFQGEILHLATQLDTVAQELKLPFRVTPSVTSQWESHSGKMAHYLLLDALAAACDELEGLVRENPELKSLVLLPIEDDGAGY